MHLAGRALELAIGGVFDLALTEPRRDSKHKHAVPAVSRRRAPRPAASASTHLEPLAQCATSERQDDKSPTSRFTNLRPSQGREWRPAPLLLGLELAAKQQPIADGRVGDIAEARSGLLGSVLVLGFTG